MHFNLWVLYVSCSIALSVFTRNFNHSCLDKQYICSFMLLYMRCFKLHSDTVCYPCPIQSIAIITNLLKSKSQRNSFEIRLPKKKHMITSKHFKFVLFLFYLKVSQLALFFHCNAAKKTL